MIAERLLSVASTSLAHAHPHDGEGFRGGENGAMSRPGVVGVTMGDDGTVDPSDRIDKKAAGFAEQALGENAKPAFGMRRHHMGGR